MCDNHSNIISSNESETSTQALSNYIFRDGPVNAGVNFSKLADIEQMAVGYGSTCAIVENGHVRCWGTNRYGQAGVETPDDDSLIPTTKTPVRNLNLGAKVLQVGAGIYFVCVLLETHEVKCWGNGENDQLGYGFKETSTSKPRTINLGVVAAKQLSVGLNHACVLMENGAVKCWGYSGEHGSDLGYREKDYRKPKSNNREIPSLDLGDKKVISVTAGGYATCVLFDDGKIKCWGEYESYFNGIDTDTSGILLKNIKPVPSRNEFFR